MKARLNLTIEEQLLEKVKAYAATKKSSLSELVENYFRTVTDVPVRKSIIDVVEALPKPDLNADEDLKKSYLEDNAKKYGF